jgi:hypothetical protein
MNNQPILPAEPVATSQLRGWTRFPPDTREICVIFGDVRKTATLVDESYGGIGVTFATDDWAGVQVGDKLTVLQAGHPTPGQIQWIQPDEASGKTRCGICWSS